MKKAIRPSTIDALTELEREMATAQRSDVVEALREVLAVVVRPSRGWITTGQAAERLDVTIPTIKNWINRGTLIGRLLEGRWRVSEESVDKVLSIRKSLADLQEEGSPTEEEIYQITKNVRRQMGTSGRAHRAS